MSEITYKRELKKEKSLFNKIIFYTLFFILMLCLKLYIDIKSNKDAIELASISIETLGLILAILSYESFIISYKRLKAPAIFAISLIYLNIIMSMFLGYLRFFDIFFTNFQFSNYTIIMTYSLRAFILLVSLSSDCKIRNFLDANKKSSIIFIISYSLIIKITSPYVEISTNLKLFNVCNILMGIVCIYSAIKLLITFIKTKDYHYIILATSIFLIGTKSFYFIEVQCTRDFGNIILSIGVGSAIFLILILGCFLELYLYINEAKILNEELTIFHNLTENNKYSYVFICDSKGDINYKNKKLREEYSDSFKYNQNKKLNFSDMIPKDNYEDITNALKTNDFYRNIVKFKNNTYADCFIQVLDSNNKYVTNKNIAVTFTDISELINKEVELEKLKVYNREKVDFISNISHELRTPINIFSSTLQLLDNFREDNNSNLNFYYDKYRNALHTNCKRMLKLVNNLIDISRIDVGVLHCNFDYYNLVSIVEDVTLSVSNYAQLKSISIHFDTNTEEFITLCDSSMIERILLNLLSNAIKFTPENKNIYVNMIQLDNSICIYIKDEGIGIQSHELDSIFQRFVQSDKSISRQNEGSGIGLSLVKSLVELHHGTISVDSTLGIGSVFEIILPKKGDSPDICKIYDLDNYNTQLELSDIYEVLNTSY